MTKRISWGQIKDVNLPELDLVKVQRDSFEKFLESGIKEVIDEISPVEDFTGKNFILAFGDYSFGKPKHTPDEAVKKGITYDVPLKIEATVTNKQTGDKNTQEVFLCDLPLMLEKGSFIVNGIERAVVTQLVRAPGVYYSAEIDPATGKVLYNCEIRPLRGSWLEFAITKNDVITVKIDRRRKFPVTTFLRAIGFEDNDAIIKLFEPVIDENTKHFVLNTLEKDSTSTQDEALLEIYRRMRPGDHVILDNAKALIENMFFNPRRYSLGKVGRYKVEKRLKHIKGKVTNSQNSDAESQILTSHDFIASIAYLFELLAGKGRVDDIDHLGNRRLRRVGELVAQNAFRIGMLRLERVIKERMSLTPVDEPLPSPATLINARPIISAINEFFRSSQLSTILDQTNPLAELDNLRRLTVMGTGGIARERAAFSIRDINHSQYSRICPIRSPEGPNIGLVTYMALYCRVNDYGFLEAPYRKVEKDKNGKAVVTNEIVYLAADDEEDYYITHAQIAVDSKGYIAEERVPVRYNGEFTTAAQNMVNFIDVVPRQVVGTSASLIPFLAHDEANRALMGTHMQCQAVPLIKPQSPIVGTGMEEVVGINMGRAVRTPQDGEVIYVDSKKVIIKTKSSSGKSEEVTIPIQKFARSPQSTCYSQRPRVTSGEKIKKGDIIIDGSATEDGELALGQNLTIAYMSFDGLGYEDAIVISDRLSKEDVLTSIHIEEYETSVVETKLGPEETTRDIPNVSEEDLANLDDEGIVVVGAEVGPNDILVGKIAPKGETELTAEERLLRTIFGEKAREVRDTSLRMPHGEKGTVIDIKILSRDKGDELEHGAVSKIVVKVAQMRKVVVGDKLAGRHGNKGVISKIVPQADMPYMEDGTPIDIIISPLSVLSRMNLGQLLETHLGWAADKLNYKVALPVFEQIHEDNIVSELKKAGLPTDGRATLYDGRTGLTFDRPIVVGKAYIMKLIHMVEDKTHARSTGPYSLITQQPLGGKAQMGGQRLGEMEVWALEAYGAAYTLQEMLTIKSDDVVGRAKAFEAIIKGEEIPQALIPESFKVLVKELNSLSLNVQTVGAKTVEEEKVTPKTEEEARKGLELAVASGEEIVGVESEIAKSKGPMELEEAAEVQKTP